MHPLKQVFITTFGTLALLALSLALLGHPEGFEEFFNRFYQIIIGALAPSSTGAQLLRSGYEFLTVNTFFACLGAVGSKMAAANRLPIPILNGGDVILIAANWVKPMSSEVKERIRLFGGLILLLLLACWLAAFYFVLRSV